jgi:hypothetical protein
MTDVDDWTDPCRDDREPDPEDHEEARANEEYWQHCDDAHGGERCTCWRHPQVPAGDPIAYDEEPPFL